jgi:CTP synthase
VIEKKEEVSSLEKQFRLFLILQMRLKIECNCLNSGDYDIVITEIGGTVGDIESLPH